MPPLRCPSCGALLNIPQAQPGQRVRLLCPKCKQVINAKVPGQPPPAATEAAPSAAPAAPTAPASAPAPPPPQQQLDPGEMAFDLPEPEKPKDRGTLADVPLPWTIAKLFREKWSGTLHVVAAGEHAFMFRQGDIVSFTSSESRVGLLEVLRVTRKISNEVYHEYLSQSEAADLAQALVDAGHLDGARASAARAKGCEELIRFLAAASGEWRIEPGASGPRFLKLATDRVVLDALRTAMPDPVLRRFIPELAMKLRFVQGAHAFFQSLPLTDPEQRLLMSVDGKRTFGEILAASGDLDGTSRSMGALVAFGVIEAADRATGWGPPPGLKVPPLPPSPLTLLTAPPATAPVRKPAPPPPPPPTPQPVSPVAKTVPITSRAPASPPPPPPPAKPPAAAEFSFVLDIEEQVRGTTVDMLPPEMAEPASGPHVEAAYDVPEASSSSTGDFVFEATAARSAVSGPVRGVVADAPWINMPPADEAADVVKELHQLLFDLEGKTHHEVLSVALDADIKAIKRSYFAFAKRYHPDKFFSLNDEALNEDVDKLYTKVTVAFEILKDPARREEYELTLMRPPEKSLDMQSEVVQAELKFQEAMAQFNRRELRPALDSVKWAVKLNNDKPKYHALLGRLFMQETTLDVEGAAIAFKRAFELEPKVAMHKVNLGKAYLRGGNVDDAKKCFREAYFLDRDCHEAIRELRLLDKRGDDAEAAQRVKAPAPKKRNVDDKGFFGKLLKKG